MKFRLRPTGLRRYTRKHLRHDLDAARAEALRLDGVIRERDTTVRARDERISQLEADAVDVSVERQLRLLAEDKADDYERRFYELKATFDNEHAISLPPAYRDTEDGTDTQPIPVPVLELPAALSPSAA